MNSQQLFKKQNNNSHIKAAWSKHNKNIYQHSYLLQKFCWYLKRKLYMHGKKWNIAILNKEKKYSKSQTVLVAS